MAIVGVKGFTLLDAIRSVGYRIRDGYKEVKSTRLPFFCGRIFFLEVRTPFSLRFVRVLRCTYIIIRYYYGDEASGVVLSVWRRYCSLENGPFFNKL